LFDENPTIVRQKNLFWILFLCGLSAAAQKLKKEDKELLSNLQTHVRFLADDKLEGRRTGTPGEKAAADYIRGAFEKEGLQPKGTNGYFQTFTIDEGREIEPGTSLVIDGHRLLLAHEYIPLALSADGLLKAEPSLALRENHMPWFYDVKEVLEENAGNPHFDLGEKILAVAKEAERKTATALFVINTGNTNDGLQFDGRDHAEKVHIPVVYITAPAVKKYLSDESATLHIELKIKTGERTRTCTNVAGYIDNGAPTTVVIGAHYDHLGHGEDGGSREMENKGQIHNGADDNASGTAALIELGRLLKVSKLKANNYVLLAFSGEELGLFGSKYFTEHPTVDLTSVNYMINMDMVGRLSDSTHVLTVGGYGTSPSWGSLYNQKGKARLYDHDLAFRFDSSGTGPSDHTSFYLKNIPVLFYFTGLHPDYHKPTDDVDRLNFMGELTVVKHIYSLIEAEDKTKARLVFSKTRDEQTGTSARFSVTLGIMPDYTFNGAGVRVDGVSDNRPASHAGIKTGDVILSVGAYKTTSLESYMQALGKFKKGDKTTVTYKRGEQTLLTDISF
jgi:aminopeptidase YwaD